MLLNTRAPSSYGLTRVGLKDFCEPFIQNPPRPTIQDRLRETTMAHRLQEIARDGRRVLMVCGLAHAGRLLDLLEKPQPLPLSRPRSAAEPANLTPESIREGKISLDAMEVAIKSSAATKIESGAPMDVKTNAILTLKGSLIKIN